MRAQRPADLGDDHALVGQQVHLAVGQELEIVHRAQMRPDRPVLLPAIGAPEMHPAINSPGSDPAAVWRKCRRVERARHVDIPQRLAAAANGAAWMDGAPPWRSGLLLSRR